MSGTIRIDRRRAIMLAALSAVGLSGGHFAEDGVEAARKSVGRKHSASARASKRNGKKKNGKHGSGKSGGSSGQEIVRVAKKFKGSKYVWAGASPKGFDCSGFTWYVYDQVTGKDIGRTVKGQFKQGQSVSRGSWKPGDIVFFKNTYEKGLSHCGIYVSGEKFIHAENEDTGVVISTLTSGYYKEHYAGARRLV